MKTMTVAAPNSPSLSPNTTPCSLSPSITPPTSSSATPSLSKVDRLRCLGSGTCGTIWLIHHQSSSHIYALKVLYGNHDRAFCSQINRKIDILRTADNPSVVRCHAMFDHAGEIQILLEHMDDGALENRHITSEPFLSHVTCQILQDLTYLHRCKIVHHDIKPSNLLMTTISR